ncbi:MAG: hypothetical protein ACRDK7_00995 [Solirubrobacteraceae bacterium]
MSHATLALACLGLLAVIAAQDWLYPPLRNESISAGLTGPYHALLDASYVPVSATLILACRGQGWMEAFAVIAGVALLLVAASNTAWRFFDSVSGGRHAKLHSTFTLVVFASVLALQLVGDRGGMWTITALNVLMPAVAYAYFHYRPTTIYGTTIAASPAAEKLYVAGLCAWLIAWSI